jgi:SnoaL-like domain
MGDARSPRVPVVHSGRLTVDYETLAIRRIRRQHLGCAATTDVICVMRVDNKAQLIKEFYAARARRDWGAVRALLASDVVWREAGEEDYSGEHHGRDEVTALLRRLVEVTEGSFRLEALDFVATAAASRGEAAGAWRPSPWAGDTGRESIRVWAAERAARHVLDLARFRVSTRGRRPHLP